tara:strand:+ start:67 stop:501 length:435 start_codon:yes stop_codon:yes gene_type:complete
MRKKYSNFINEEEKENLISDFFPLRNKLKSTNNNIINKILIKLQEDFEFKIKNESYFLIEQNSDGHKWHLDTGNHNHMPWCQIGVSMLLSEPNETGITYYAEDENGTNKIKINRNIFDLLAHTSDEWHMVTPNNNNRTVLLMFI